MTTPFFTVVVPVYNAAATIAATVRSVLTQTERDFELLLIDDGSTDDSLAIMLRLGAEDDRIRVLSHRNQGVASTRNLGVDLARGALIAFLDSDDAWHPTKLERHRALHAVDPDIGISFARIAFLEAQKAVHAEVRTCSTVPAGDLTLTQVIGENPVCTASNIVVTRDCLAAVGLFTVGMDYAEDQEWLARAVDAGIRVRGIDELLVAYRLSPAGLSSNLHAMYDGWRRLTRPYRDRIDVPAAEALFCRYLSRRALRNGGTATAALRFACRGVSLDAGTFFADAKRGSLTLAAAIVSPVIPRTVRTRVFA